MFNIRYFYRLVANTTLKQTKSASYTTKNLPKLIVINNSVAAKFHTHVPKLSEQSWFIAMSDNRYAIDYAKRVAGCKKCKGKFEKGELRIAKVTANPFSDEGDMKMYHHPACIFETFKRVRPGTKIIEEPGDLEGWSDVKDDDKERVLQLIRDHEASPKKGATPKKTPAKKPAAAAAKKTKTSPKVASVETKAKEEDVKVETRAPVNPNHKDNSFREWRKLCASIADLPGYLDKTAAVAKFLNKGTDGAKFQGDLHVWVRLLLPGVIKRIYNMQSKQMVKVFSRIFETSEEEMLTDLEQGDVAETIAKFFEESNTIRPIKKSELTVHIIDNYLNDLTKLTKEDEQQHMLKKIAKQCTSNELKMFIRLMKHDLRIQAGAKHILEGIHPEAYEAFNSSRNVVKVIDQVLEVREAGTPKASLNVGATIMQPVQPMLAQACKSVDMAFQKCPNGMYSEIKYDGERVQLHKKGNVFKYFSRSLKPVMAHKVKHFNEHIPKAFPDGSDLILDCEVLMVDNKNGKPLPFGTLGVHKGSGFKDATPCLFVFDCIFYNGKNLLNTPLDERRKHLEEHMVEVGNNVKFSEMKVIKKKPQLVDMIKDVLKQGLEGLVLKDIKSTYEPGKRHWLKVKKDYLNEGAMADTADLVVLGGWYGTGKKGGIISVFLMGCYDRMKDKWCTVTKVHTGHDDATLERLQGQLQPKMTKISGDYDRVPHWLNVTRQMVPDFIAKDPKVTPVWEITGAEFSKAELHTAAGISIRFPRVTKMRDDKTWETATSLKELQHLFKESKEHTEIDLAGGTDSSPSTSRNSSPVKPKQVQPKKEIDVKKEVEDDYGAETDEDDDYGAETDEDEKEDKDCFGTNGDDAIPPDTKNIATNPTKEIQTMSGFHLKEVDGDLFTSNSSLCHCISKDCRLGKGVAKIFREKFGRIKELEESGAKIGGVATLKVGDRYIYNLVTKPKYSDKPSYDSLRRSLEAMKEHALLHNVDKISMPKIGCGLDGLSWPAVRTLIKNVFQKHDIKITVYCFGESSNGGASKVKQEKKSPHKDKDHHNKDKYKQSSISQLFSKEPKKESNSSDKRKHESKEELKESSKNDERGEPSKKVHVGSGYYTSNPLPDVFVGLKIFLNPGIKDEGKLKRFLTGYGAEILKDHEITTATHIVYPDGLEKTDSGPKASHVTHQWVVDSIKLKEVQDVKYYRIAGNSAEFDTLHLRNRVVTESLSHVNEGWTEESL